jgi:putative addiction module component (TIGR02574 family)
METLLKDGIVRAILSMPPFERIEIIDKIYEGFESDKSENYERLWAEEADSRVEAYLKGDIAAIPLEEVMKEISGLR